MNCCTQQQGLNQVFTPGAARAEVERYRRRGLDRANRALADSVVRRGVQGATVLEVGGGIGGIQLELLKAGAAHTVDVDISRGYVQAARDLAASLGFAERAEHRALDFALESAQVDAADVVVMNRVVCCYPDMPALVVPAAQRARRVLALVFPRDAWWVRLGMRVLNAGLWLVRRDFRAFAHSNEQIIALACAGGLRPVQDETRGIWRLIVFERAAA
ncbi:MAG: class I SAM-dependent methyltransferase [Chloroflexi bacterium]|nr:class I SAM-dependent methyltransferase [Chloroflexota bacterium]